MMNRMDQLLTALAEAPDSQIDKKITPRIAALVGKDRATVNETLKVILDECVHGSLCSDFSVNVMSIILELKPDD